MGRNKYERAIGQEPEGDLWSFTVSNSNNLPLQAAVGVYPRQSGASQHGNVSTAIQSECVEIAKKLGWTDEHIVVYKEDIVVSGRKKMYERLGFSRMIDDITNGRVKAVLAVDVDRFFRDEWGSQYTTFMELCYEHDVIVITPDFISNFKREDHREIFVFNCRRTAMYLKFQVRSRLQYPRKYLQQRGYYAGLGSPPVGYDVDKKPDSPTYRKFIPYRPHAEVVRWLFERYNELQLDVLALAKEIWEKKYILFPLLDDTASDLLRGKLRVTPVTKDGTALGVSKESRQGAEIVGYTLHRAGLESLLCNPTYIGT
ncbi:hypothetical protein KSC_034560 [Ktedonobacter sp. SOSP1-52]|uniref:recombinase family protein n=1 Tax=Ktedonobacter sp. SOSP1-52 TaxID=2778366 RepID=UPI001915A95B|nr:recombinase family protein [Ktedonobacter sp. SOSP1-52]GHO64564.1 hypothetical protein KSC_034560 [Ktedonobacter sp. SOSP1-52]